MHKLQIISGGQTGVDIAALRAAKGLGIPTGGWMPKNFLTEDGRRPEYAGLYGMQEMDTYDYPARTRKNVEESDITIWLNIDYDNKSLGYFCTRKAAKEHCKKCIEVGMILDRPHHLVSKILEDESRPNILNIAGPRESSRPGIEDRAFEWLSSFLLELHTNLLLDERVFR